MQSSIEILRTVETTFDEYQGQVVSLLLSERTPPFTSDEIQVLRGRGVAAKQLLAQLRNILGYDPANL